MLKNLIGTKAFYKKLLLLCLPIMLQNAITNFVNLLDNIMVGKVGTEQMSAVSIVNQLIFIFNLCVFGALSGIGLFTAQMHGNGDKAGVKKTFVLKLIIALIISAIGIAVLYFLREPLINIYLNEGGEGDLQLTLSYAKQYILIMLIGFLPFAFAQSVASTQRELGYSVAPMVCGLSAVAVNMVLNYILIFGKFGAPTLGVRGAAIATVTSRFVELFALWIYSFFHRKRYYFMSLAASDFRLEKSTVFRILKKGFPLFINEALWATGISLLTACYSLRGLDTVASLNIAATLHNVFNMIAVSLGTAVSILMGQKLGANLVEEAKSDVPKIQAFSVLLGVIVGGLLACFARFFPQIYNTTPAIRAVATKFILVLSCTMPVVSYLNTCYFTIRSGGKTLITFLFDSVFMCCVNLPLAYLLSRFSPWNIVVVYAIVWGIDFVKCIIGTFILKSGSWANNMNAAPPAEPALEATAVATGVNVTSAEGDL